MADAGTHEDANADISDREISESDGRGDAERIAQRPPREPDVLVDLPQLHVEDVNLEVNDLQARVSLQANVLSLLRLNVGADVSLGGLQFGIKSVDAQGQVRVRLDDLAAILDRVLTTIDRNPQIVERLVEGAGRAVEQVGHGAGRTVEDIGEGASGAVHEVGRGAGSVADSVGESAGSAVEDVRQGLQSAVETASQSRAEDPRDAKWKTES